jgi:hypothetical protein
MSDQYIIPLDFFSSFSESIARVIRNSPTVPAPNATRGPDRRFIVPLPAFRGVLFVMI